MKKNFLVIGNPIDHSLSPKLHNYWIKKYKIDAVYGKKLLNSNEIKELIFNIREEKIHGINVKVNRNGIVHIQGSEKVSIHAPTIDVEAKRMLRVVSSGNFVLDIKNVSELNTGMCKAFSNSSSVKPPVNGMSKNYTKEV